MLGVVQVVMQKGSIPKLSDGLETCHDLEAELPRPMPAEPEVIFSSHAQRLSNSVSDCMCSVSVAVRSICSIGGNGRAAAAAAAALVLAKEEKSRETTSDTALDLLAHSMGPKFF